MLDDRNGSTLVADCLDQCEGTPRPSNMEVNKMSGNDFGLKAPEDGQGYWVDGDLYYLKLHSSEIGGAYAVFELTIAPYAPGPPPHRHAEASEAFYILDGSLTMSVEGQDVIATPGTFSFVPPGTTHTFSNPNPAPAKVFKIVSPGGFEDFFVEYGQPATTRSNPLAEVPMPDVEKATMLAEKYRVEFDLDEFMPSD